jgi:uncharacterized protein involved in exopolysaccharide biosynthesis
LDVETYDLGEDEPDEKPRRPGLPVEPRRLIAILGERRKALLRAFAIASAVSVVAFFLLPKTYEAEAVLLYEGSPVLDAEGMPPTPSAFVKSAFVPSRLAEIRERLGWDVTLEELGTQLEVKLQSETSVRLAATDDSADSAYDLASASLDVFLAHQIEFNSKELQTLALQNEASIARARKRREEAQAAFEVFRAESGRPDLLNEKAQLLTRAAEMRAQQDEAEVEAAAQGALIAELEELQGDLPRQVVSSAKKGSGTEGALTEARAELAQARATFSDEHPRVLALKERVARLQAQRRREPQELTEKTVTLNPARASVDHQLASARAALAAAEERKAALRVLLDEVKRDAAALSPEEGEARRVLAELSAAAARVEKLMERDAQLRDAALTPINRFRLLSPPVPPEASSRSGKQVGAVVLFPLLAVFVCALIILIRRLSELTVRAPREVAWWGNGPVLGTTFWPRRLDALDAFVDELEDQGVYGSGRTLVVPATEIERDHACSFAMRLADAPWLAAAILDVGERAKESSLVTPAPPDTVPLVTPSPYLSPRRLSSDASPSVRGGPGAPNAPSRPPRKHTVIGLPAVASSSSESPSVSSVPPAHSTHSGTPSGGPQPFQRKRSARATIRMLIPAPTGAAPANDSGVPDTGAEEEAFLLTRPVPTSSGGNPSVGPAVLVDSGTQHANSSNAVMRAAIRLLGESDEDLTELRRSEPPRQAKSADVTGVALAWNGPLSGPVLRRAARLAHRVIVVVSSGASAVDLTRVQTRLGREDGVGYVLINAEDAFAELQDRIGPVEEFWQGRPDTEG